MDVDSSGAHDRSGHGFGLTASGLGDLGNFGRLGVFCLFKSNVYPVVLDVWLILAVSFPIGVWACGVTGKQMGVQDDSSIVFDEIWAFWLVLAMLSPMHFSFLEQSIAFGLFRLFDIWKPYPIRQVDARVKGGFGVMIDDVLAALYTLLVFSAGVQLYQWLVR